MTETAFFSQQVELVFDTQKHKRRGKDSMAYEVDWVRKTVKGYNARLDGTLRIDYNYAFLTPRPRWREIMATEFEGRKIDHEICDNVIPLAEKVLSPYSFNNRVGKGSQAAINQLIEHIYEVSEGYTKPTRIMKLDFKGYFPHALWDYAEKCINEVIDLSDESEEYKNYLRWLTMLAVHCNPAAHCELRSPHYLWEEHIEDEKSILIKDEGEGAAIGRLIWQTAMGLYINDVIIWLTETCCIRLVCFVDDIAMVIPEERHQEVLALIPTLRQMLASRNVRLNEKKFYDQPYQHGVEFLGTHIKCYRVHLNNNTYGRAIDCLRLLNEKRYKDVPNFLQSINSYTGLLKNRTDYKRLMALVDMVSDEWKQYVEWDERRLCFVAKEPYNEKNRLNQKFNLNLKHINHDNPRKTQ